MHNCSGNRVISSDVRAFGDAGQRGSAEGVSGEPKGLTRALKIENSKWPIFPADGTETKSRLAFIMTCIAVRAAVICTVSLQNAPCIDVAPTQGSIDSCTRNCIDTPDDFMHPAIRLGRLAVAVAGSSSLLNLATLFC